MNTKRKVERLEDKQWVLMEMEDLKKGDIFRLTEPNEETPFGVYRADSKSYRDENTGAWEVRAWEVKCVPFEED